MFSSNLIRMIGLVLMAFSPTFLLPMLVAFIYTEPQYYLPFLLSSGLVFLLGSLLWFPRRKIKTEFRAKEGFLIVFLLWLLLSLSCSLPFLFAFPLDITLANAVFEAVSGLTATGSTVMTDLVNLPRAILYYRQQLQFLGGMGIILLAIAVLPSLGYGSMRLFRAEISGPVKENQLTPRIAQTAKAIWSIYLGLTLFCIIGYWAAGMDLFDAIGYSFGTVSTGGYTTHNASMGYFSNPGIQLIGVVFMFLSALNFSLHFIAVHTGSLRHYWRDIELKTFVFSILIITLLFTIILVKQGTFPLTHQALVESLFHVTSLATTTGMSAAQYWNWPLMLPIVLLVLGLIGGCSGSTSGGIKIIRAVVLSKQSAREINRLIHPQAYYSVKLGKNLLSQRVLDATWGFLAIYFGLYIIFIILLMGTNLDFITAFSATGAALSNIGPGLGQVSQNFQSLSDSAKYLLSLGMLVGRLELFTALVLLSPTYWRS